MPLKSQPLILMLGDSLAVLGDIAKSTAQKLERLPERYVMPKVIARETVEQAEQFLRDTQHNIVGMVIGPKAANNPQEIAGLISKVRGGEFSSITRVGDESSFMIAIQHHKDMDFGTKLNNALRPGKEALLKSNKTLLPCYISPSDTPDFKAAIVNSPELLRLPPVTKIPAEAGTILEKPKFVPTTAKELGQ